MNCLVLHGFSPVNARLLITCDTAFYAIIDGREVFYFVCVFFYYEFGISVHVFNNFIEVATST